MSERLLPHNLPERVRDWVEETLGFLLKAPLPGGNVRLAGPTDPPAAPEVGLVVQYWGEDEGEIVLLASRGAAASFIARLGRPAPPPGGGEEMKLVKGTLGEMLNIFSSRLLAAHSPGGRHRRLTTPSCIFGKDLCIAPEDGETAAVGVVTPFGRLDFHLRLGG